MPDFASKWDKRDKLTFGKKIVKRLRNPTLSRKKLEEAVKSIQTQIISLDNLLLRLKERDKHIFSEVIKCIKLRNKRKASIYANELTQIRNLIRQVIFAKLALERICIRINTITDAGEVAAALAPAVSAVRSVQDVIREVVPQAEEGFTEISTLLSGILVDASANEGFQLDIREASADAERIIEEASRVAEEELKAKFPEVPQEFFIRGDNEISI
jgi:division protein CdvB (Snf7/Vps24/ESCRT-III family)